MGNTPEPPPLHPPQRPSATPTFEFQTQFFNFTNFVFDRKPKAEKPLEKAYPFKRKPVIVSPTRVTSLPPQKIPMTPFSFQQLNPEAQKAFHDFQKIGAKLPTQDFTLNLVKKEYRRLLKASHPDLNPQKFNLEHFASLQKSFKVLENALLSLSSPIPQKK